MDWSVGSERIIETGETNAVIGHVQWSPIKSIWIATMTAVAIIGGPLFFTWTGLTLFLILCCITLCAGHSVGMHRKLIHNSFECPLWLEYILVYSGVLVGMAGPFGLMKQHDMRDWAQRKPDCHAFLCHSNPILKDAWWQLHCDLKLKYPPTFQPEQRIANDKIFLLMERTWMWHQLPLALILLNFGGVSWVIWGVAARVSVCVTGHWLVGYFAHNEGPMRWRVKGAGVQGHDVPIAALLSMGESWHNNHHAYPGSAKLGLDYDQPDPGWWFILALKRFGLIWDVKTPDNMPSREALVRLSENKGGCKVTRMLISK